MKKALIEKATKRICQVEPVNADPQSGGIPFPVHDGLEWRDCPDNVTPETHDFDGSAFVAKPVPPAPTLEEVKAIAAASIDLKAGEVRRRYITATAGQEGTYLIKERQAEAYKAALYIGLVPALVQAELDAKLAAGQVVTLQQACDAILAERDAWLVKAAQIEKVRREGKLKVQDALTADGVVVIRNDTVAALDRL